MGRITRLIENGTLFADLGIAPLDPGTDRVMICGSMSMLKMSRRWSKQPGFDEGSHSHPGGFVVERAFVD